MLRYPARYLPAIVLISLCSCAGPHSGRRGGALLGPPSLQVAFDSASATAHLRWECPDVPSFRHYQVERSTGREFKVLAQVEGRKDTTYDDGGLLGNTTYRYRIVSTYGKDGGQEQSLTSVTVEGGIHGFVNTWPLSDGFLPTRLVVDERGTVSVLGAGAGWVERFDWGGNPLGHWEFTSAPLACLETGTLDGPAAALDADGNLYVVYNTLEPGGGPAASWTKFSRDGKILWTAPLATVFARHIAINGDQIYVESISQLQQFSVDGERLSEYRVPALLVSSLRFWRGAFAALVEPLNVSTLGWQAPRLVVYSGIQRGEVQVAMGRDPLSPEDHGAGLLNRPSDFAPAEGPDRAFVVNSGRSRIEVFREGSYLTRWGTEGDEHGAFQFRGRARVIDDIAAGTTREKEVVAGGIARDRQGFVYVADTFNNRIQKFQP